MNLIGWAAALALMLQATPPASAPLAPTGKWEAAFEDDLCALGHSFGQGRSTVTLAFRPVPLYDRMETVLLLPNRFGLRAKGPGKVTLLPSGETFEATFDAFATPNSVRAVHIEFARAAFEKLGTATGLVIDADKRTYRFDLPPIQRARSILNDCEASLLKAWGVDPALRGREQAGLADNPGKFFSGNDYPEAALATGTDGKTVALLEISPAGRVSSCRIVKSSMSTVLDRRTCEIARASLRYTPARGPDDKPVTSVTVLPVRWQLPTG